MPHCPSQPYQVSLEEGKTYYWCTCGLSQNQPFCDGQHKGTGLKSQSFVASTTGVHILCGCKKSAHTPICDGTHTKL